MLDVSLDNIESLLKLGLIKVNLVYPISKNSHFRLENDLSVRLSNDAVIVIPRNFEFDGSSAPRGIWWLFPSYGDFFFAALIHDYLYSTKYLSDDFGFNFAQKFADDEMLIWSNKLNNKTYWKIVDNQMRHRAVRWFGKRVYNKNK